MSRVNDQSTSSANTCNSDGDVWVSWVVTPVKGDPQGLRETRDSLLQQTHTNWRHVVVVAESSGPVANAALAWSDDSRTQVILGADSGVYSAMNVGWDACGSGYVQFLNAGDTYASADSLGLMMREVQGSLWGFGPIIEEEGPRGKVYVWPRIPNYSNLTLRRQSIRVCHQSVLVRCHDGDHTLRFDESMTVSADYQLLLNLAHDGDPVQWSRPVVRFKAGGLSYNRPWKAAWECHQARRSSAAGQPGSTLASDWLTLARVGARLSAGRTATRLGLRGP